MGRKRKLEVHRGSGNVFRDFGYADADVRQTKAILAAKVIEVLNEGKLSTRKAQSLTGVDQADFARIRSAQLERFTIDRLMNILNRLHRRVEVNVRLRRLRQPANGPHSRVRRARAA